MDETVHEFDHMQSSVDEDCRAYEGKHLSLQGLPVFVHPAGQ